MVAKNAGTACKTRQGCLACGQPDCRSRCGAGNEVADFYRQSGAQRPGDEDHAKRILRILRSNNHQESAENIKLWAIKNGWLPKAAERLAVLADKAFALRTKPKLDNPEHTSKLYQRWCEAAPT